MVRFIRLATLLGLIAAGCTASEEPQRIAFDLENLPISAKTVCATEGNCLWQSSDWQGDVWMDYPGQATLVIDHALGRSPTSVIVYVSFDDRGEGPALGAGDLARIINVSDTQVEIKNSTNSNLFARVVLR